MKQTIIIFYNLDTWVNILFDQIIKALPKSLVSRSIKSKYNKQIRLRGGSTILFIYASESSCGLRYNQAYIQPGIDKNIYQQIILPMSRNIRPVYIVNNINDIIDPRMTANEYYLIQENEENGTIYN